ncbi:prominin-1-A isoform X2 [Neocloeon triangulifer]|uniref:prominin-1-A isoform X2 n=1 Tax=Neocloeon triangulifer TaxID=2078957 RepID=UPI00286F9716|nr:prominin-1-A isoform X2 [Neocloeon triangulifer]
MLLRKLMLVLLCVAVQGAHDDCHTHPLCQVEVVQQQVKVVATEEPPEEEDQEVQATEAAGPAEEKELESQIEPTPHVSDISNLSAESKLQEPDLEEVEATSDERRGVEFGGNNNMLSTLVFPQVPRGDLYRLQKFGLDDGFFVFSYVANFLGLFQPADYPLELANDAMQSRLSLADVIIKSLSFEPGFVALLVVFGVLALVAPFGLATFGCVEASRKCRSTKESDDASSSSCDSIRDGCGNCRRRGVLCCLQILVVLIAAGLTGIFVANEQLGSGMERSPAVMDAAFSDLSTYLKNSHKQLHFVVSSALDQTVDATITDLDNIESILGRPIQREIAGETGVDVAMDVLMDISMSTHTIAERAVTLQQSAGAVRTLSRTTQDRLAELKMQVDSFRRTCNLRDRPLCDTIDSAGLEVKIDLDKIMNDVRLADLRRLRNDTLSSTAQQARSEFQFIPHQMAATTREARLGVKRELDMQRILIKEQLRGLDDLTKHLNNKIQQMRDWTLSNMEGVPEIEEWRWLVGLLTASSVLLIWTVLMSAISCGCCGSERKAGCTLIFALLLLAVLSIALWGVVVMAVVIGGHGELFVCRPLYQEPDFTVITTLFDKPNMFFGNKKPGLFSNVGYKNDTLDVPIRTVLAECRDNRPAYETFKLSRVFNAETATAFKTWHGLHAELDRMSVDQSFRNLQLLTPSLQKTLQGLLDTTSVDLSSLRGSLSGSVTAKDLTSFATQMENVANQIKDGATTGRLRSLVTKTRKLISTNILPLETRRDELVYQLTALEVQLIPIEKQITQSMSHLKTIQYFIGNQGTNIAQEKMRQFTERILNYVAQFQDYVVDSVQDTVAPCRPIWNVFQGVRQLLCRHLMDPLNGLWFCTMWCMVMFLMAIPTSIKLIGYFDQLRKSSLLARSQTGSQESPPGPSWTSPDEPDQVEIW